MRLSTRLHMLHRVWRYRLRSERNELAFVLGRDLDCATVLDVGANWGIYAYWLHKKVGPRGTVVAFEPQLELGRHLHDFKAAFGLKNLIIANVGLSSRNGSATLVRARGHWGGASLELPPREDTDCLTVELTTLDAYFAQRPELRPIRLIKCDVEGHEFDVFRGGEQVLRQDRPELLFECADRVVREGKLFGFLESLGYQGFYFFRRRLTPVTTYAALRHAIDRPYLNYVFVPTASAKAMAWRPIRAA